MKPEDFEKPKWTGKWKPEERGERIKVPLKRAVTVKPAINWSTTALNYDVFEQTFNDAWTGNEMTIATTNTMGPSTPGEYSTQALQVWCFVKVLYNETEFLNRGDGWIPSWITPYIAERLRQKMYTGKNAYADAWRRGMALSEDGRRQIAAPIAEFCLQGIFGPLVNVPRLLEWDTSAFPNLALQASTPGANDDPAELPTFGQTCDRAFSFDD